MLMINYTTWMSESDKLCHVCHSAQLVAEVVEYDGYISLPEMITFRGS